jgi:uncharacterized damage-inducible protein DinB
MTTATATKPTTITPKQRALDGLRFARSLTASMLKDFPEDKVTYQPCTSDNHVLWNLGHLAATYQWLAAMLDGEPRTIPAGYDELFGGKSKPVSDPTKYPSLTELRRAYDKSAERFIAAFEATSDDELTKPAIGETYGFVSDRLDTAFKGAWHEGWHQGQISSIRRALKLPPVMG